jgi:hypothetical protein
VAWLARQPPADVRQAGVLPQAPRQLSILHARPAVVPESLPVGRPAAALVLEAQGLRGLHEAQRLLLREHCRHLRARGAGLGRRGRRGWGAARCGSRVLPFLIILA